MILAIDMGNSNIKIGVVRCNGEMVEERVTTAYDKTSMEYVVDILSILNFHGIRKKDIKGAIISSVVPPLTGIIATAVRKVLGIQPIIVSSELKMDITLEHFPNPPSVGADLIVGAEGAFKFYRLPAIIINMGTATTITVVDEKGAFRGGVLLPGMKVSLASLTQSTAQLPDVGLKEPGSCIEVNTAEAIRNGVIYGNAAQIDGIIERQEAELGQKCSLIITGGMAQFVAPYCRKQLVHDDGLLMKGLLELYKLNS